MKYRAEIDGLRAIAVIPVIFFHAGFELFRGGFVGVDVFFVISGYLITKILIEDLEKGKFSLIKFYERRARRILPALFFVMLCCLPPALMWMSTGRFEDFSKSLIAVSLFASNILFWRESGYFEASAEEKPLLHTWSLAVEEQYYVFFPIFLLLAWRMGYRRVFWAIVTIALLSLFISEWGWRHKPSANFYLLPSRAWEILSGSIACFIMHYRETAKNNVLAILGFVMVIASIVLFDKSTPFPSLWSLIPVGGTVLMLMFCRQGTAMAAFLSNKILVGIGLISYSTYLWHQPLFAFARIRLVEEPTVLLSFILIACSLVLAAFSWRYVEQPFRGKGSKFKTQSSIFLFSAAGLVAFMIVGAFGVYMKGFPQRLPGHIHKIEAAGQSVVLACESVTNFRTCNIGDTSRPPTLALVGDSHAGRYAYALDKLLQKEAQGLYYASGAWCAPLIDFSTKDISKNSLGCKNKVNSALKNIAKNPDIVTVILSAEWGNYTQGFRHGSIVSAYAYAGSGNQNPLKNPLEFEKALSATLKLFQENGKTVIFIKPVPEYHYNIPETLHKISLHNLDIGQIELSKEAYLERNKELFSILENETYAKLIRIDPSEKFCDERVCRPYNEDQLPLYSDDNHLSALGLKYIEDDIIQTLRRLSSD